MTLHKNIAVALIVALTGAVFARADEKFEKFASAQGRFTVEMPGKPTETTEKTPGGQTLHYTNVKSLIERYQVIYFDVPENVVRSNDPQKLFKAYTEGAYRGAKLQEEKKISFGPDNVPGFEYRVETVFKTDNGGMVPIFSRDRLVLTSNRLY